MIPETLAVVVILIGGYPLLVLLIAITGPHNEAEKREKAKLRWRNRRVHKS